MTRLLKAIAVLGLGVLLPGLLNAAVVKQSFSYDAAGRLTGVSVADQTDAGEQYRYDASGNIVEKTINGRTVTMTYDAANQLLTQTDASGTTRFVYDSAGRLVEEQRGGEILASYQYGYLDKVTSVTRGGLVTNFHYNARGMLVAKERDGKIIETLGWDGIGLIARGDTVFANEAHISGGVPLVAATSDGSAASYFDSDYLGTTTASYTADGEVNAYEHGSFGQGTEFADARFTGKHYDADLGAHVFPFRNYRSDAGRWTSADPAGFPDGPNQHFYAPVPTTGLDPLGLEWIPVPGRESAIPWSDTDWFYIEHSGMTTGKKWYRYSFKWFDIGGHSFVRGGADTTYSTSATVQKTWQIGAESDGVSIGVSNTVTLGTGSTITLENASNQEWDDNGYTGYKGSVLVVEVKQEYIYIPDYVGETPMSFGDALEPRIRTMKETTRTGVRYSYEEQ